MTNVEQNVELTPVQKAIANGETFPVQLADDVGEEEVDELVVEVKDPTIQ